MDGIEIVKFALQCTSHPDPDVWSYLFEGIDGADSTNYIRDLVSVARNASNRSKAKISAYLPTVAWNACNCSTITRTRLATGLDRLEVDQSRIN